jgi:pre-mRNA-splicing factor CWC22
VQLCIYFIRAGLILVLSDIFKLDPNYLENEEKYKSIKAEILGEDSDDESGSEESSDDDEDEGV